MYMYVAVYVYYEHLIVSCPIDSNVTQASKRINTYTYKAEKNPLLV